jgi:AhpD family alkylhydroperoxidase
MEEILDTKTQLLVAVAAAAAAKCQKCFVKLHGMAGAAGVSAREMRAAVAIAAKVSARSQQYMAEFIEATTDGSVTTSQERTPGTAGPCGCG